jgi:putative transcriptional regulator
MSKRNIGQELLDSIREIKAGKGKSFRVSTPEQIIETRAAVGVSQSEFADLLGISCRTLQDWEQGRRQPNQSAQSLLTIARKRPDVVKETLLDD